MSEFSTADFYGSADDAAEADDVPEVGAPEVEAPEDADPVTAEADDDKVEVTVQPEVNYFDPSQYEGHVARVKLDGEEIDVPVTELVQGWQRQADYTRKTQEVAQERERLSFWGQVDAAMRVNPAETMAYLAKSFGVQDAAPEATEADDDWGYTDPADAKLAAFQQQVAPALEYYQQQQAREIVTSVTEGLSQKYGDDFNAKEVLTEALNRGVHDPSMLEAVFKDMMFEKYRGQTAAQQQAAATRAAADAAKTTAAQKAAGVIGSGTSSGGVGSTAAPAPAGKLTVAQAWALSKTELGLD